MVLNFLFCMRAEKFGWDGGFGWPVTAAHQINVAYSQL
jgi:hypothetical protein